MERETYQRSEKPCGDLVSVRVSFGVHERMDEGRHTLSERVGEHGCVDLFYRM